jgi:cytochrome c oxidase cbb3-type subunit 3
MNKKQQQSGWEKLIQSLTKAHELGKEEDIMMDHDYDGIRELDNYYLRGGLLDLLLLY